MSKLNDLNIKYEKVEKFGMIIFVTKKFSVSVVDKNNEFAVSYKNKTVSFKAEELDTIEFSKKE